MKKEPFKIGAEIFRVVTKKGEKILLRGRYMGKGYMRLLWFPYGFRGFMGIFKSGKNYGYPTPSVLPVIGKWHDTRHAAFVAARCTKYASQIEEVP